MEVRKKKRKKIRKEKKELKMLTWTRTSKVLTLKTFNNYQRFFARWVLNSLK